MVPRILLYGVLLGVLLGCQTTPTTDSSARFFYIPTGSTLTLHRDVFIPAEQAHAYIQHGQVMLLKNTNLYYPNCKLRVRDIAAVKQKVESGTFRITNSRLYTEIFGLTQLDGLQIAGPVFDVAMNGDLGDIMYVTSLKLYSQEQPDVITLICQQLDDPGNGRYVTFPEITKTLGNLASIALPEQ